MRMVVHAPYRAQNETSAIARRIDEALAVTGHEVTRVDTGFDGDSDDGVIPWSAEAAVSSAHAEGDAMLFYVGAGSLHDTGLTWLSRVPGVVILHDRLFDLADGGVEVGPVDPALARVISRASGVIVGDPAFAEYVRPHATGPVGVLSLEWPGPGTSSAQAPRPGRVRLLTFSEDLEEDRLEEIVEALGSNLDLAARVDFHVAGIIDDARRHDIQLRAGELGLSVSILGPLAESELERELAEAEIVCALVVPPVGAVSSALKAAAGGRPAVVSDAGDRELPHDVVIRVPHEAPRPSLDNALVRLVASAALRGALGARASSFVSSRHTPESAAVFIVDFLKAAREREPVRRMLVEVAESLAGWGYRGSPEVANAVTGPLAIFDS